MTKIATVLTGIAFVLLGSIGLFSGGLWGAVGIALALLLWLGTTLSSRQVIWPCRPLAMLAAFTLLVFGLETLLSPHIGVAAHTWLNLVSIFLPLLLLTAPSLQNKIKFEPWLLAAVTATAAGAVLLSLELQSGGAVLQALKKDHAHLSDYNRGIAHMAILSFALFAALAQQKAWRSFALLAALLFFSAALTESHTAKLAMLLGGGVTLLALAKPDWVKNLCRSVLVLLPGWPFYARALFAADYANIETWHSSWRHRMEIWDYLSYRIAERPVFGWGLGTTHLLDFHTPHSDLYHLVIQPAPHAHNIFTELWVETGVIGVGLGVVFLWIPLSAIDRLAPPLRPFAYGAWLAAVTVANLGFDFWTDALWAAFALTAFAFGIVHQTTKREKHLIHA